MTTTELNKLGAKSTAKSWQVITWDLTIFADLQVIDFALVLTKNKVMTEKGRSCFRRKCGVIK